MKRRRRSRIPCVAAVLCGAVPFILFGCGPQQAVIVPAGGLVGPISPPPDYRIQPGDQLDVKFFYNPELNETVLVRDDGKISLQLIDEVAAAGLTPAQLHEELVRRYTPELRRPVATVLVRASTGHRVYVGGEVGTPGLLTLVPGMTALQAVINAGGFKETARPGAVLIIRKGPDSRPVPIRVDLDADDPFDRDATGQGDILLEASDIVYVPKTFIAHADLFVNQYIERLLLYRGISLGFAYNFGPRAVVR